MSRPPTPESRYTDTVALFVERVVAMRKDRGMSQADVAAEARKLGHPMGRATLSKIEADLRRPTLEDVLALAEVLGTTPGRLLATPDEAHAELLADFTDLEAERIHQAAATVREAIHRARKELEAAEAALGNAD